MVFLIDGSNAAVTGSELEILDEPIKVYNLEVADYNTFFVGDEAVLVHNYGPNGSKKCTPYDPSNMSVETHHVATNKNPYYTPDFEEIAGRYGLDLDDDWNKIEIAHRGTHPWEYHEYILDEMIKYDEIANGDLSKFMSMFDFLKKILMANPEMLYTEFWRK